jgi:hypothetical protein
LGVSGLGEAYVITDQETNALCLLSQKGNTKAQERLLKGCEPYMQSLVNQVKLKFPLPEGHLLQEARIAFWEASKTFSPVKGRFLPYAAKKASWAFQRAYKEAMESIHLPDTTLRAKLPSKATKKAIKVKLAGRDSDESYAWGTLADTSLSPLDRVIHEENLAKVWDVLPEDPEERELVVRHFGLKTGVPIPYSELAKHKQTAHNKVKFALFKMGVGLRSHAFTQKTKRRPNAEL